MVPWSCLERFVNICLIFQDLPRDSNAQKISEKELERKKISEDIEQLCLLTQRSYFNLESLISGRFCKDQFVCEKMCSRGGSLELLGKICEYKFDLPRSSER